MVRGLVLGVSMTDMNAVRWYVAVFFLVTLWPIAATAQTSSPGQVAQVPPPPLQPIPFPPKPPRLPEQLPPVEPPPLEPPVPQPPIQREEITGPSVFVKEIRLTGNTAFTDRELAEVTEPYTNRVVTTEDLEALRLALTYYYVSHGYVTSGAVIPDQSVTDGVVTVQIIEGKLADIEIEGNRWFRSSYFQNRIALNAGPPLNVNALQERLQLLQIDPRIQRLNAELRPGLTLGESVLNVQVADANPFRAWLEFNNFQSPTVGAEQGLITLADENLFGFGDMLSLQYGRSLGVNPILNFRYAIPVTARDTLVAVQYRRFDFAVVTGQFEALDIKNKAEIYSLSVRQPVYRALDQEFALALIGDYEKNESFLGGEPAELIPGAIDGVFRVAALRFAQEYVRRSTNQIFSALSRFSFGIGVLGATNASRPNAANSRFFSWLGEAQYVRQFQTLRTQLVSRAVLQLANDHLFPLEQIAVGGRFSVRGYREYTLVRDNAFLASVEARVPVYRNATGMDTVFLAPFVDFGRGWETNVPTPTTPPKTLASVGLGLIWNFWRGSHFEVYWGKQLNHFEAGEGNLQDHGIHLQLVVQAL